MDTVEPRTSVSWRSVRAWMSWSPTRIEPDSWARRLGNNRISARNVTDLPDPDSPMMQSTSPGAMANDTPLTALTVASRVTNFTARSCTSTRGRGASPFPGAGVIEPRHERFGATAKLGSGRRRPAEARRDYARRRHPACDMRQDETSDRSNFQSPALLQRTPLAQ